MNHNDAMEILHFAALEKAARADFDAAHSDMDAARMADAALRWELAENCIPAEMLPPQ
jgi:hypothetical protein